MNSALIRYHEVALKRGNRPYFVELLKRNLRSSVEGLGLKEVKNLPGRLCMVFNGEADSDEIRRRLACVFGVANFSFAERTAVDLEDLKSKILESLKGKEFSSFRIQTKRADKTFPLNSPDVNREVGAAVKAYSGAQVDLKNAELTIGIEILSRDAFFSLDKIPGPGG